MSQNSIAVDDVSGSERYSSIASVLDEASVVSGNLVAQIGEHWDGHLAKTSLLSVLLGPLLVGKVGVDGAGDNLAVEGIEFGLLVRELNDLGWAHESEVERVEEKNDVFALELLERDLSEFLVPVSHTLEGWSWLSNLADLFGNWG